ncbi:hypothetical protein [Bordetella avium]|uniref:hypothetical protein n=1 Tax=Bordetella avium TaxID=521 RepID=UPI000E0C86C5|nr:hypothetical protein [Bordetella avium]AZY49775.1 hypothetical protein C0J09_11940 [Bordetella avium]AZY53115.1 hypothetical protein C0J07_11865 [Bordetella avium]RIQ12541.1 hypothetical protein D0432_12985 [Bordetella avium]RIQ17632.1 hypothetical protein D0850_09175 [Bordetella avium]RIQ32289.1 hypothetical protein D0849_12220 [Bordetella avium]
MRWLPLIFLALTAGSASAFPSFEDARDGWPPDWVTGFPDSDFFHFKHGNGSSSITTIDTRKVDAQGIGWYSNVRVSLLERRDALICAVFGRDGTLVVAGCGKPQELMPLAQHLISNKPFRVYLNHRIRYAPLQGLDTFRITRISP